MQQRKAQYLRRFLRFHELFRLGNKIHYKIALSKFKDKKIMPFFKLMDRNRGSLITESAQTWARFGHRLGNEKWHSLQAMPFQWVMEIEFQRKGFYC